MSRRSLAAMLVAGLMIAACGDAGSSAGDDGAGDGTIAAPSSVAEDGKLQICVDATYPPAEYLSDDGVTKIGFDIDIGEDLAQRFGLEAQWVDTGFDAIIPALNAEKCELIISALTDNEERRQQIDFVDYVDVGSAFLVPPGNPQALSSIEDLCGLNAAIIIGENWQDFLDEQDSACKSAGEAGVTVSAYNSSSDEVRQLSLGRVDLIVTNTVNAAWLAQDPNNEEILEVADAEPFTQNPMGIGLRKGESELKDAVTAGVRAMYDDGTIEDIFAEYGMADVFLPHRP